MSDWQVGDLAVCVDAGPSKFDGRPCPLAEGVAYTIADIVLPGEYRHLRKCVHGALKVSGSRYYYIASRFRKIRPDKHEDCEPEFVTLLKRTKVAA
jgi:hypothetical protein